MLGMEQYAGAVLSSYAASLVLLAALLVLTFRRGRKARRDLEAVEKRVKGDG
jgi:heme exporter protein D